MKETDLHQVEAMTIVGLGPLSLPLGNEGKEPKGPRGDNLTHS